MAARRSDAAVLARHRRPHGRGLKVTLYPVHPDGHPRRQRPARSLWRRASRPPIPGAAAITLRWRRASRARPTGRRAPPTRSRPSSAPPRPATSPSSATTVAYSGPDDWSLRRMILHYANLAAAGGVDAFLIGSELRGLTHAPRRAPAPFPSSTRCATSRPMCGACSAPGPKLTYAADWSEYFGYQPADGSGDVFFHLDPLWAAADIDFVGIDNYMPLADWRDGDDHLDAAPGTPDASAAYLARQHRRRRGLRLVLRQRRRPRRADCARRSPTAPMASPGSSAPRTSSAGGATPTTTGRAASSSARRPPGCRKASRSGSPNSAARRSTRAPTSRTSSPIRSRPTAACRISPPARATTWCSGASSKRRSPTGTRTPGLWKRQPDLLGLWRADARPWRDPPVDLGRAALSGLSLLDDVWADGANWETGHWLNGRLGALAVDGLVAQVLADYGIDADVGDIDGTVDGFLICKLSARQALEPLSQLLGSTPTSPTVRSASSGATGGRARPLARTILPRKTAQPLIKVRRTEEPNCRRSWRSTSSIRSPIFAPARSIRGGSSAAAGGASRPIPGGAELRGGRRARRRASPGALGRARDDSLALPPSDLSLEPADLCALELARAAQAAGHPRRGRRAAPDRGA